MKKARIAFIYFFIILLVLPIPFSLILSKKDFEDEKKEPADFPTEISNDYFNRIIEWFNDRSPFRTELISFFNNTDNQIENSFFKFITSVFNYEKPKTLDDYLTMESLLENPYLDYISDYYPAKSQGDVIFGRDDWLFYSADGALNDYLGSNIIENGQIDVYAGIMEKIQNSAE